ncbi:alpha-2-macroglobulin family protein [Siculibacillus lacustris]|uniref:Alpha-2-macroglobulin family protein n=1 Tax=Siculibacillus lacustris TaxID=1549641 RepID=A0A4Q9VKE5_9HYPH|nr:alpha-2-macroglobulin [Siculibacillus lacustris]TBW35375.1 alpha-2-macroglobulin family protein [Siculibacillus lacustris]
MKTLLRAVATAVLLATAMVPATAADKLLSRDGLASDAVRLETQFKAAATKPAELEPLRKAGEAALAKRDFAGAEQIYGRAIALAPKDWSLWTAYAAAAAQVDVADYSARWKLRSAAHAAAYAGYRLATTPKDEATALTTLAGTYVRSEDNREALAILRVALKTGENPQARAEYERLRPEFGFKIADYKVDSDAASPRACFTFSDDLKTSGKFDYAPFVAVSGLATPAITVEARQICVDGLEHGKRYGIVLRAGLPSTVGEDLTKAADYDIYVRDRSPQVRFTGRNYVLPRSGQEGLPVVTVNTPSVEIRVHRIGDRSLAPTLRGETFLKSLDGRQAKKIAEEDGRLMWTGTLAVASELNKDTVTAFPVLEAVGRLEPGIYVMTAKLPGTSAKDENGDEADAYESRATQWFLVSDLGLTAFSGENGIDVVVRSLGDAKPVAEAEIRLLAKNNDILATKKTDATGRATFEAGLTRGSGGAAPGVVVAGDGKGDYGFLDLAQAAFDLGDRGVKGRAVPKGLDAFVATERGVYRTGETVDVTALLRDTRGVAVPNLPLTLVAQRPDGVEYRRQAVADQGDGGRAWSLALISGLQTGTWRIRAYADPKQPPIGETSFLVADYVPERIDVTLTTPKPRLAAGEPAVVEVQADHLYGAPGAELDLRGDVAVSLADDTPIPGLAGYTVGLDDESFEAVSKELEELGTTDAKGHARLTVEIPPAVSTRPLQAKIDVAVAESGGRAVERVITLPILPAGPVIAVKPLFDAGALAAGSKAEFDVVSTLPDGTRREAKGVTWQLLEVTTRHQWFNSDGRWDFEAIKTTRRIADGRIDLATSGPARLAVPVDWGSYRLDLRSADGAIHTSKTFAVGWAGSDKADAPDVLDVALDKTAYGRGESVQVRVKPRFAGTATVAIVTDKVEAMKVVEVGNDGATVAFPVDPAWGAGAHALAIAHRPLDVQAHRQPGRAVGVAWFAVEPTAHRLQVGLAVPEMIRPRGTLKIPVKIQGAAAGETARVVVAAVDVGILNLTRYETPDPDGWFFGQRLLATDLRDLYGYLIDGMQGTRGKITAGGDGGADMGAAPPREAPFSRYSGVVEVGADGTAEIAFDVPAFNGTVRVMAMAWTKTRVGHGARDVVVRDAVVIQPTVPRFLALGDRSTLTLALDNVDGPAGDYRVDLDVRGPLVIPAEAFSAKATLAAKGRGVITVPVTAAGLGPTSIAVRLTGGGIDATQTVSLAVQPPTREVHRRTVKPLAPGASLTVGPELLADYLPGTGAVSVSASTWSALEVPALLRELDRYPYGCTEQVVSRALPLLYVNKLAAESRLALDSAIDERIRAAIDRVLTRQDANGSFGLWGVGGEDLWLDSYVVDFLTRARERGFAVPPKAFDLALDRLRNHVVNTTEPKPADGPDLAYAIYDLARNGRPVMGDLRYLTDQKIDVFPSPLSRAQLAAGLALLGDRNRAEPVFRGALERLAAIAGQRMWRADYGSPLRDGAAVMTLMAESGRPPIDWAKAGEAVEKARDAQRYTSTQEQAWMVLAAAATPKDAERQKIAVDDGVAPEDKAGSYYRTFRGEELEAHAVTVANKGETAARVVVTTAGAPIGQDPPASFGYQVERTFHKADGTKVDPSRVRQTDRLVVVLKVTEAKAEAARIVLVDRLPAGFEIADPKLVDGGEVQAFSWLEGSVVPVRSEFLDDRFVAAFDREASQSAFFNVAYAIRAVTPGRYVLPPAVVEDMYRPERFGRTGFGTVEVTPAK